MSSIMIVEDDHLKLELFGKLLTARGAEPVMIDDGGQAEAFIDNANALLQLVLLDAMLPSRSGMELLQKIRRDERWRQVPVVMLSARSRERDIVQAFDLGVDDYVAKPFSPEELFSRVTRLVTQ